MSDATRAGPPPKRKRGPAGTGTAQVESTNNANTTTPDYNALSASLEHLPQAELDAWCDRKGIPVVSIDDTAAMEALVASGAPAWIAIDFWCCNDEQMAYALQHATYLVTFDDEINDNADRFYARAVTLAALGERVVFALWTHGEPVQLVPGRRY